MGRSPEQNARLSGEDTPSDALRAAPAIPEGGEALGSTVGRGASWVMLASGLGKIATLVAQVVLASLLTDVEFGVFATASALGWFVGILKDAGTNTMLLQRGVDEYERVAGPLFWINTTLATLSAFVIAGIGALMSVQSPDHPQIAYILYVIACSTPLQVVGGQLQTKLRQDLRFAKFSQIQLTSAILRQILTIVLAMVGAGAMSLAWPYVLCAIYEGISAYFATKEKVWLRKADVRAWGQFLRHGWWTFVGTGANFLLDQGAYLVMGFALPKSVTGQFFFAFQLVAQTGVLLGYAVQQVLIPALVKLNDQPKRQAEASIRALRAMSLVGSITCVGLSVCIEPLRALLWPGKWAQAVPAVIILGMFFPWRIQFGLTTALLHAQGRFKRHAYLTLLEGGGVIVATLAATLLPTIVSGLPDADATTLAWWVGTWLFVGRVIVSVVVFRFMRVPLSSIIGATVWSWLIAVAAGLATLALDRALQLEARSRDLASIAVQAFGPALPKPWMTEVPAQTFRLFILGGTCSSLYLVAVRWLQRDTLVATLFMVPVRLRPLATGMLGLTKAPPSATAD